MLTPSTAYAAQRVDGRRHVIIDYNKLYICANIWIATISLDAFSNG
jgi:hypothetical protein